MTPFLFHDVILDKAYCYIGRHSAMNVTNVGACTRRVWIRMWGMKKWLLTSTAGRNVGNYLRTVDHDAKPSSLSDAESFP